MKKYLFSYSYIMKKKILAAFLPLLFSLLVLLPLAGCAKTYDYTAHLSEIRRDIFLAETEEFTLTLSCAEREHPYASDGVACPRSMLMEAVLIPKDKSVESFTILLDGWGGEMSFRNVRGDWFYSQGVTSFPEGSVSLRISWEDGETEVAATSVKTENTLSCKEALARAVEEEKALVKSMTREGAFRGEFYVRLLRRDKNYYYVGIVNEAGETVSLLLDAESGEVLARRPKRQ